jgi:hypothetical protein
MAIHTEDAKATNGRKKKINAGAYSLVFDNLQRSNYKYPIKSTIRELVANGVDAIRERKNAVAILTGKAKESDFYYVPGTNPDVDESIAQNPGLYADSQFDPSYYNLKFLEQKEEAAEVIYMEGSILNRDVLIIRDSGVGLWGERLEGYFDLAFSTKRLNKEALGKFGLGSKVPLSTGVPYYTMISRYNGREISFNIYSENVESVIPPMNLDTGEVHERHVMSKVDPDDEDEVYYSRATDKKNGTEIHTQIKKHNKSEVLSAVQNQLLYFSNVTLNVVDENYTVKQTINVQADILYEDDKIIISDNTQFSKPHIVINNVSYGYLDYLEMEIEEKNGNIGIKVSPTEVEVSHSRESVIWSEQTKNTILERFRQVKDIAAAYVSRTLTETDYLKWIKLCQNVVHSGMSNGDNKQSKVLKAFSGVSDLKELSFKYPGNDKIKYSNNPLYAAPFMKFHYITRKQVRKGNDMVQKLDRTTPTSCNWDPNVQPILLKGEDVHYSFRKDMYLTSLYPSGYIVISYPRAETDNEEFEIRKMRSKGNAPEDYYELIKNSEGVRSWDEIVVPESFSIKDEDEDKDITENKETAETAVKVSVKERRKLEGKIVGQTPRVCLGGHLERSSGPSLYENQKVELKPADVNTNTQLYYGTKEYEVLLMLAASLTRPIDEDKPEDRYTLLPISGYPQKACTSWGPEAKIHLLQISKENEAYFAHDWAHITKFFSSIDNGIITMDNQLITWNTARIVGKYINSKLKFLGNYQAIDSEMHNLYVEVKNYYTKYFIDYEQLIAGGYVHATRDIFDSLLLHMDKVAELHVLCDPAVAASPEEIRDHAVRLFPDDANADSVKGAVGIDLDIHAKLMQLLEYAQPINTMLNMNLKLCNTNYTMTLEEELEVKQYIKFKTESI